MNQTQQFQNRLLDWYDQFGRKNLPWQVDNAYYVWISEIMLQQTQVIKVIDYFNTFIKEFPNLESLANATVDEVLKMWSGLGYYNRAKNIHKTAQICATKYHNQMPQELGELISLPGIGRTTAGAILSLSWNLPFSILDGNVKRVVSRVFRIADENQVNFEKKMWNKVDELISLTRPKNYNQALMDLGSLVCKRSNPECEICPFTRTCLAKEHNKINHYPQRKIKTKQIPLTLNVYLCIKKDKLLLVKRKDSGIWAQLWFLPCYDKPITSIRVDSVFSFTHILSHRILTINVAVTDDVNLFKNHGEWVEISKINELPHPSALKKVLKLYKKSKNKI